MPRYALPVVPNTIYCYGSKLQQFIEAFGRLALALQGGSPFLFEGLSDPQTLPNIEYEATQKKFSDPSRILLFVQVSHAILASTASINQSVSPFTAVLQSQF